MTHVELEWADALLSWTVTIEQRFRRGVSDVLRREAGQDIVEYALLTGLLSITALLVIILVGPYLKNEFQDVINGINLG